MDKYVVIQNTWNEEDDIELFDYMENKNYNV